MNHETEISSAAATESSAPSVRIFGVGNAGATLLGALNQVEFSSAQFAVVNTDAAALAASSAPVKINLENKLLRGLGSGGDPERGRALAEEQFSLLKSACEGANVVFINADTMGTHLMGGPTQAIPSTAATMRLIKKEHNLKRDMYVAPNDVLSPKGVSTRLGIRGLPTSFLLSANGTIEKVFVGPQDWKKGDI